MPQDQWQDTLADAAKTDEQNSPWEIDMYRVIAHDAPEKKTTSTARRPPTPAKAAGYQSLSRVATDTRKSCRARLQFFVSRRSVAAAFFSAAPVRRIGSLVSWQAFHACKPTPERWVIHLDGHEAGGQLARLRTLERAAQKLDSRKDHHVDGGKTLSHDPVRFRQAGLDGARLVGDVVHIVGDFLRPELGIAARGRTAIENRLHDIHQVRLDIGLVLANDAHDDSGLFRRAAENVGLGVLQIQVIEHREGLE